MKTCIRLLSTSCCCALLASSSLAQIDDGYPVDWQGPRLYPLIFSTAELNPLERAQTFVDWMESHDWRSVELELHDVYNLYDKVNVDALDHAQFSARWSGFLTAPSTGIYTLRQVRDYSDRDSRLKVVINDKTVLDSISDPSNEARFTSQQVQLTASEAVPIQVEMVHDVPPPIGRFSSGAPMVLLTWKTNQTPEAIIPTTSFSPPPGFAPAGSLGLKGEYFRDTQLNQLLLTRLDPALDLVWSFPPVAGIHHEQAQECLNMCKAEVLDGAFLAAAATQGKDTVFDYNLWRIAYRMTATERLELVQKLTGNPDVLATMTPRAMGRLMQAIYMLPGKEHLELLGTWALTRPQPRCQAGAFPGWGEGRYQTLNTDFYWLMGLFQQGPYENDVEKLWDDYLSRPDGECNLAIAYATAFAARIADKQAEFNARLQDKIDDSSLSGDQLMTWYLARAFAKEARWGRPRPLAGLSDLQGAFISAEDTDYSFWALQEIVARLSSLNKGQRAKEWIDLHKGQFNTPQQQAEMGQWIAAAETLKAAYAARRDATAEEARQAYLSELQRRRQRGIESGADVSRYDTLIEATSGQ